ncbi:hypothetical protein Rsub_12186 [Raphidocelis subcapitata]|uniref:Uncharacterized protein n=1 Tax=Raphidocelis subcapitata TaxID=307507 RepID=A0A2V0PK39_9CHLO|nr:hypothetical protein Rsub_12186 [Raphidocelis subcapitata]|eukprot:GBF99382.1 hypothetical protein Rsub_12186 [Raphidocelis subcapitata]
MAGAMALEVEKAPQPSRLGGGAGGAEAAAAQAVGVGGGGGGSGKAPAAPSALASLPRSLRHDTLPRWLRMSIKLAVLTLLLALPSLALRDPKLRGTELGANPKFGMIFMLLGVIAIPMWVPHVGTLVLTFTAVIPIALSAVWVAYGLFLAYPNVYFLQISTVVVTFLLLFGGNMVGVPAGLLGVFVALYAVGVGHFLMAPKIALVLAKTLSLTVVVAAFLVTTVFAVVLPEYCTDLVWQGHHEGLEHLLHMAHHVVGSKPPRLLYRGVKSEARRLGSNDAARAALRAASSKDLNDPSDDDDDDDDEGGLASQAGPRTGRPKRGKRVALELTSAQRGERSYHRMLLALTTGAKAQGGAKAELVLGFCGSIRPVLPWFPLLPAARCRSNPKHLLTLRADVTALALSLYKLQATMELLDAATRPVLKTVATESGAGWDSLKAHLLAALQDVVDAFPMDAYPAPRRLDASHAEAFATQASEMWGAWQQRVAAGDADGADASDASPAARLHATLLMRHLEELGSELTRVVAAAQAAMDDLAASAYGFMGFPCLRPEAHAAPAS